MQRIPILLCAVLLTFGTLTAEPVRPLRPQADPQGGWCATSPATMDKLDRVRRSAQARAAREVRADAVASVREHNGVHVVTADATMLPHDKPVDLAGSSLRFERVDAGSYRAVKTALAYDTNVGTQIAVPRNGTFEQALPFSFPFFGQTISTLHVSERFGLQTETIPLNGVAPLQYGPLELLTERAPTIAPLLLPAMPPGANATTRTVHARTTGDAVTITWRMTPDPAAPNVPETRLDVDVQARVQRDGTIVFSYRKLANLTWGGAIVSPGSVDWNAGRTVFGRLTDVAGDAQGAPEWRTITDISEVELARVDGSDLLDIRVRFAAPFNPQTVPPGGGIVSLTLNDGVGGTAQINTWIDPGEVYTCLPSWNCTQSETFVRFDGESLRVRLLEEHLALKDTGLTVIARTWHPSGVADEVRGSAVMTPRVRFVETDLSALTTPATLRGAIVEGFTLPILEPQAVYDLVKAQYGFNDAEIDGVAIYQSSPTDIVLYAGAYSTMGNAGADGISRSSNVGSQRARRPALLHMNRVLPSRPDDDRYSLRVLAHELGHRWLYHFTIDENGKSTRSLNPLSAHPAAYVHTPAAFPLYGSNESSTMGGGFFTQTGSSFRTQNVIYNTGFSWHDLYLMGLASPAEVTPWFYIAGSNPELPGQYYPPAETTVAGTRVDVGVDQIIRSMGPRYPTSEFSQRHLRTLFILVEPPHTPATEAHVAKVGAFARNFETYFAKATGNRATTRNTLPVPPSASFSSSVSGAHVQFRDTSTDYPSSWSWSFGDGTTSTQQHPAHMYAGAGRYTVTVTVSNSRGSSTHSKIVEIAGGNDRRRAARH